MGSRGKLPAVPHPETLAKVEIPEPPPWLSEAALAEWHRITAEMFAARTITLLDRNAIATYCKLFAEVNEIEEALSAPDENGLPRSIGKRLLRINSATKTVLRHPLVLIQSDKLAMMNTLARDLGLTPSSRQRLQAGELADPDAAPRSTLNWRQVHEAELKALREKAGGQGG